MNQILFWTAVGLIIYAYAGFPLLLFVRGALLHRPISKAAVTPRVSLVIVAYNEVETIGAKIENIFQLDYPPELLEVLIASDGSDDGTDELVAGYASRNVRLLRCPRSGKIPALNAAVAQTTGEVLVFSDANSMYRPDALRALAAPFADPSVGAVGGNQCYISSSGSQATGLGERLYWSYDRMLKLMQSRADSMTSATGAIHAIRRELFRTVPLGVSDDFFISTGAIAQGYRLVFEPNAIAYEAVTPTDHAEFQRKQRVIARGLRGLAIVRPLLNPFRYGFYSLQLFSHKFLRWSVCWLLIVAFLSSLSLYHESLVYQSLTQAQLAFYLCAVSVFALRSTPLAGFRYFRVASVPFYFCLANYAALRAWLRVGGGKRVDMWSPHREVRRSTGARL